MRQSGTNDAKREAAAPPVEGSPDGGAPQDELTRRRFLGRTAAGMMAGFAVPSPAPLRASGSAADRVRIGIVGVRRRGSELALALAGRSDVEVAAICDPDAAARRACLRELAGVQPRVPAALSESRRLFDDARLDAVVIATPDQTHAPLALAACSAGKDVYLETPVTHSRDEADQLLAARGDRIIQCGLQQRSGAHFQSAVSLVQSGGIGRVGLVRAWAVHRRGFDRAGAAASDRQWRWFWSSGSGELGHLGVHLLDVARWGAGVESPLRVTAQGLRLREDLPGETPDTLSVQYEYPEVTLTWEHRLWSDHGIEGRSAGVAFHGTDGTLVVDRGGWKVYGRKDGQSAPASPLLEPHLEDFLAAIRTRRRPAADLETGCISSALCHLGNEAYLAGREIRPASGTVLDV